MCVGVWVGGGYCSVRALGVDTTAGVVQCVADSALPLTHARTLVDLSVLVAVAFCCGCVCGCVCECVRVSLCWQLDA